MERTRPSDSLRERLARSLDELEGLAPPERPRTASTPPPAPGLQQRLQRLRAKPLKDLSVEELRLAISEREGLEHLVPLALSRVEQDPWTSGDFYPGDLLVALARLGAQYWTMEQAHYARLHAVLERVLTTPVPWEVPASALADLRAARGRFAAA